MRYTIERRTAFRWLIVDWVHNVYVKIDVDDEDRQTIKRLKLMTEKLVKVNRLNWAGEYVDEHLTVEDFLYGRTISFEQLKEMEAFEANAHKAIDWLGGVLNNPRNYGTKTREI